DCATAGLPLPHALSDPQAATLPRPGPAAQGRADRTLGRLPLARLMSDRAHGVRRLKPRPTRQEANGRGRALPPRNGLATRAWASKAGIASAPVIWLTPC